MSSAGYGDGDREAARKSEVQKMIKDAFSLFDRDSKGVCDVREVGTIVRHLGICPTEIELRDMITEVRAVPASIPTPPSSGPTATSVHHQRAPARRPPLPPPSPPGAPPQIEEEEPTGFIRFEKFERMMARILLENQYPRDSEDKLLRAFRVRTPARKRLLAPPPAPSPGRREPASRAPTVLARARVQTLDPDNKGYIEAEKLRNLLTTHGERFSQEEIDDFLSFASDSESGLMHYEDYVMQVTVS